MNYSDICILCMVLSFRTVWSSLHPISPCYFDHARFERPFIYATSKSPDDIVEIFGSNQKYISPLTLQQVKGNFTLADEEPAYCKVPKDGVYAIFLQINVQQILSHPDSETHVIGVSKVTEHFHSVREFVIANRYLSTTFTGPAFCANLTSLAKNDLLFVFFDSYIQLQFETVVSPIQLIAYMVSPNLEAV